MQGAKGAAVISAFYVLSLPITNPYFNMGELAGDLTFGLAVTFLFWWVICAAIVWVWRKVTAAIAPALAIMLILVLGFGVAAVLASPGPIASAPIPTRTPQATITPNAIAVSRTQVIMQQKTDEPSVEDSCFHSGMVTAAMENQEICVYGVVGRYRENLETGMSYFYFGETDDFFLVGTYSWEELEGECIVASGRVDLNTYGTPFIKVYDVYFCE